MGKTGMEGASVLMQRSCRTQKRGFKLLPSISEAIGHRARRGFNLIEAAIVLGVVGLVIGGIWISAASIHRKMQIQKAENLILMVSQGTYNKIQLRDFGNVAGWVELNDFIVNSGVLPKDTQIAGRPLDPWGNQMLFGLNDVGFGPYFAIEFTNVPFNICAALVAAVESHFRDGDTRIFLGSGTTSGSCDDTLQEVVFLFQVRP